MAAPLTSGRTYWLALDARWLAREGVVEAREEAGHAAVTVLLALMGQAKLENDGGRVITGYRALAREAFLSDADEAKAVVTVCHASGVLDDLEEHEDGKRFSCRISGWQSDQSKGRAADRKASSRADPEPENDDPEPKRDDESRPVTPSHVPVGTAQHRTGEKKSTPKPPQAGAGSTPTNSRAHSTNPRALAKLELVKDASRGITPKATDIAQLAEGVKANVTEQAWHSWLSSLHAVGVEEDGTLVLDTNDQTRPYVATRFHRVIAAAADECDMTVRLATADEAAGLLLRRDAA